MSEWPTFKQTRCRNFDENGASIGAGCRQYRFCKFIHPGDPRWESAPPVRRVPRDRRASAVASSSTTRAPTSREQSSHEQWPKPVRLPDSGWSQPPTENGLSNWNNFSTNKGKEREVSGNQSPAWGPQTEHVTDWGQETAPTTNWGTASPSQSDASGCASAVEPPPTILLDNSKQRRSTWEQPQTDAGWGVKRPKATPSEPRALRPVLKKINTSSIPQPPPSAPPPLLPPRPVDPVPRFSIQLPERSRPIRKTITTSGHHGRYVLAVFNAFHIGSKVSEAFAQRKKWSEQWAKPKGFNSLAPPRKAVEILNRKTAEYEANFRFLKQEFIEACAEVGAAEKEQQQRQLTNEDIERETRDMRAWLEEQTGKLLEKAGPHPFERPAKRPRLDVTSQVQTTQWTPAELESRLNHIQYIYEDQLNEFLPIERPSDHIIRAQIDVHFAEESKELEAQLADDPFKEIANTISSHAAKWKDTALALKKQFQEAASLSTLLTQTSNELAASRAELHIWETQLAEASAAVDRMEEETRAERLEQHELNLLVQNMHIHPNIANTVPDKTDLLPLLDDAVREVLQPQLDKLIPAIRENVMLTVQAVNVDVKNTVYEELQPALRIAQATYAVIGQQQTLQRVQKVAESPTIATPIPT